jgi:proteasome accessory factor A
MSGGIERVPKLCGADIELGNFILGDDSNGGTGRHASRLLLSEIEGLPQGSRWYQGGSYHSQDWGRKFLKENGGCAYIDLDHLELAMPEVRSAHDHVACWHAMLRIAHTAQEAANAKLENGKKIVALVNNSDGLGNSYGSHLDFLITRRAWDNVFCRRMHHMLFLASYQASSIVFTGQGKVGSENEMPPVPYQISQRADFFEVLVSADTTVRRPIVNCRDEALCGNSYDYDSGNVPALNMARLHVIFFDNTLCHVASLLKVGVMQIILAMIEGERVNHEMILDKPLEAVWRWSHDPSLQARTRLITGQQTTAVELQLRFLEEAVRFVEGGGCEGIVPNAQTILSLWADTLTKLKANDFDALAPRIDWILKSSIIRRAMDQHPNLTWASPELKRLDLMYSSLHDGLYWLYERNGLVERVVTDAQIERFVHEPPEDSRAWTRAMLLRRANVEEVDSVDWDEMAFWLRNEDGWPSRTKLRLANPLAFAKADTEAVFQRTATIQELLDELGTELNCRSASKLQVVLPQPPHAISNPLHSVETAVNATNEITQHREE